MQIFLIIVHVIACLFLIAVILLQAGRGGGLSDIAGGSQANSILGTETNTFMKRLTEIFAIIFLLTSLTLGIISTHRGKSLMEQKRLGQNLGKNIPPTKAQTTAAKTTATAATAPTSPVAASPVAAGTQSSSPTEGNAQ